MDPEEQALRLDPRLSQAIGLFNGREWYACHDGFEALWHETAGPMRPVLQGILQIAVAELHHERGNRRGAMILMGEGLGRLTSCPSVALGLDLDNLRDCSRRRLQALQTEQSLADLPQPSLDKAQPPSGSVD